MKFHLRLQFYSIPFLIQMPSLPFNSHSLIQMQNFRIIPNPTFQFQCPDLALNSHVTGSVLEHRIKCSFNAVNSFHSSSKTALYNVNLLIQHYPVILTRHQLLVTLLWLSVFTSFRAHFHLHAGVVDPLAAIIPCNTIYS